MTIQEIQQIADKAQRQIEGAISNAMKVRAGLCNQAAQDPSYGASIIGVNSALQALLEAHSKGIEALGSAPTGEIAPRFGGK